jgi:acyl-coenzyme A synthetase/AMP-(fatty) acid ligase
MVIPIVDHHAKAHEVALGHRQQRVVVTSTVCSSPNSGRAIMFVEAFPRTANGKLMRRALRLPDGLSTG